MTKYNQNITVHQGESRDIVVPVKKADGTPKDLTGATDVTWVVLYNDIVLITKTLVDVTIPVPTDGIIHIPLLPADTQSLDAGGLDHELWVTDGADNTSLVCEGTFTLKEGHKP